MLGSLGSLASMRTTSLSIDSCSIWLTFIATMYRSSRLSITFTP